MNAYKFMFLSFSVKDSSDFTVTSQKKKLTNELNRNEHFMIFNLLPFNSKWYRKNIYNSFWNSCESTVVTDSVGLILVHLESGLEILKIWAMVSLGIEVPVLPLSNHTTNKPSWLYQCHIFAYNIFTCELGQDDFYIWDALRDLVPFVQFKKR